MTHYAYLYLSINGQRVQVGKEFPCQDADGIDGMTGEQAAPRLEQMHLRELARASRKAAKWGVSDE